MGYKMTKESIIKHKILLDNLFLWIFSFYYFYVFLGTTMIDTKWFVPIYRLSVICVAILLVIKIITIRREELLEWGMAGLIILSCALCWREFGDKSILILGMFIVTAKDVPFRKIVSISLGIGVAIMLIAFVGSQVGLVEDLVYFMKGTYRHAFGVSYTTDFAAHVLFLVLEYAYLKKGKLNGIENGVIILLAVFIYIFCRARTNTICLVMTVTFLFLYQKRELIAEINRTIRFCMNGIKKIMIFSMPICSVIILILTWGYQQDSAVWNFLNSMLTGRLAMGHEGMMKYGLSLFGRALSMMGLGRTTVPPEFYFAIDSSYVVTLLGRGVILFIVMLLAFTLYTWKIYEKKQGYILVIIAIVAIQCIIEHHWMDVSYNFFLMAFFAKDYSFDTPVIYRRRTGITMLNDNKTGL